MPESGIGVPGFFTIAFAPVFWTLLRTSFLAAAHEDQNSCSSGYPMEGAAMRSLNHIGNVFFAKALILCKSAERCWGIAWAISLRHSTLCPP